MKILHLLAALLALTAATAPARADTAADKKLIAQFEPVFQRNDVEAARRLIAAPNFRPLLTEGPKHNTLFERALTNEQLAISRLMMNSKGWKKTKWNAVNTARPLILAANSPLLFPILKDLSRQPAFDLNTPGDEEGEFPLQYAAIKDNLIALKWLAAQPKVRLNARDKTGSNALFGADTKATIYLIKLGVTDINARNIYGMTALHNAVDMENEGKISALLAARVIEPNIRDKEKMPRTALDMALQKKDVPMSRLLMASPKVSKTNAQRALLKRLSQDAK